MADGNIMDFASKHPEVNRLRLVRHLCYLPDPPILKMVEARRGGERIAVLAFDGYYTR